MSASVKCESGIPVPEPKGAGRPREYKFEEMIVSTKSKPCCYTYDALYSTIYSCLTRFRKIPEFADMEFRISKHGENKVRVWRLK